MRIVFDFDGTLSTLRSGWEQVMRPLMLEQLASDTPETCRLVDDYIAESTGIQTIYQMEWLRDQVELRRPGQALDAWAYKELYNQRLMERVQKNTDALASGDKVAEDFLIAGAAAFVKRLFDRGIPLYVASGTDDADVKREAELLGLSRYFIKIMGAPSRQAACSKERILRQLLDEQPGEALAVIGDGKVEIALGAACGAKTIGIASDENVRCGLNPVKVERLQNAGAGLITGDFLDVEGLFAHLGL